MFVWFFYHKVRLLKTRTICSTSWHSSQHEADEVTAFLTFSFFKTKNKIWNVGFSEFFVRPPAWSGLASDPCWGSASLHIVPYPIPRTKTHTVIQYVNNTRLYSNSILSCRAKCSICLYVSRYSILTSQSRMAQHCFASSDPNSCTPMSDHIIIVL